MFHLAKCFFLLIFVVLFFTSSVYAQSVQLMQHYKQYQAFEKAGKYKQAEFYAKKALRLSKKEFGAEHRYSGDFLNNLAELYELQGHYEEAEPLYKRSLVIIEVALGKKHPNVATSLNNLAGLYYRQGRYGEAEMMFKRSLSIREAALSKNDSAVATSLNNLAALYKEQGRYSLAEELFKRSIKINEKLHGLNHPSVVRIFINLAALYFEQGFYAKSEMLYKRSLKIWENKLGKDHPDLSIVLNNIMILYMKQGRYFEAELFSQRDLVISEKTLGFNHPGVATSLNNLAQLYLLQGYYRKAEPLYQRGLKIFEKVLGADNPSVARIHNNLALLFFSQRNWRQSTDHWRQATSVITQRVAREGQLGGGLIGKKNSEVSRNSYYFSNLVKAVYRDDPSLQNGRKMFQTAQCAMQSTAAGALAQMSARQAAGSGELAKMVRERQDKVGQWQALEKLVNKRRGSGKDHKVLDSQLEAIDKRIAEIDKRLAKDFPDYAALASPKPLSVKQAQALLKPDEALILLLDTPKLKPTAAETFIWAITKDKAVWKRAKIGGKALADKVAQLRCGLDASNWKDYSAWDTKTDWEKQAKAAQQQKRNRCIALISKTSTADNKPPFALDTAFELYQKLLAPLEDVIRGKKLLVVASGALTSLPLQVLLTEKPKNPFVLSSADYQKASWLIKHYALTTLPSVASLKALRGPGKVARSAPNPLVGFADPVFRQPQPGKQHKKQARVDVKQLEGLDSLFRQSKRPKIRSVMHSYASFFKGRNADLSVLAQSLPQLEGTRRELLEVGRVLGADSKNILLGRAASETNVKQTNLAQYRIVYFATHGLIAGDVKGLGEPALAFSLPVKATKLDDGLLTASEVAALKMNADWVVMSACNTAAGDKPGAEALSGLARAFFYAGAKTLLVSHWPVGDEAAVALTTRTFKAIKDKPKLGRAQALRGSMLAMIKKGTAHPTDWAPFVVVGEGGSK